MIVSYFSEKNVICTTIECLFFGFLITARRQAVVKRALKKINDFFKCSLIFSFYGTP